MNKWTRNRAQALIPICDRLQRLRQFASCRGYEYPALVGHAEARFWTSSIGHFDIRVRGDLKMRGFLPPSGVALSTSTWHRGAWEGEFENELEIVDPFGDDFVPYDLIRKLKNGPGPSNCSSVVRAIFMHYCPDYFHELFERVLTRRDDPEGLAGTLPSLTRGPMWAAATIAVLYIAQARSDCVLAAFTEAQKREPRCAGLVQEILGANLASACHAYMQRSPPDPTRVSALYLAITKRMSNLSRLAKRDLQSEETRVALAEQIAYELG